MRIMKLLMLGGLIVVTALCFELAWVAAQDVRDALTRQRWENVDLVVSRRTAAPPPQVSAPEEESAGPERTEEAPAEPKRVTKRHRRHRAVEVQPVSPLIAPEDAIRTALRRKRTSLERCYEQELKKQATFDGFVVVSMSLSAAGKVTEAHVEEGTRRDARVGACIVAQLRLLRLPPLTEDADLLIPIRLQAQQATR